ncbi:hypothetical protein OH77DRAFT_1430355 [Trametes cingulata]|nr:hypothetical protein OH77DRAFT_1430355 [Trametes cingulata]
MTDTTDLDLAPQVIASILEKAFAPEGFYIEMGCIALVVYEYILTIRVERRVIWGRKITFPTALFLFNRYLLVALALATYLWGFVNWDSDSSCYVAGTLQCVCAIFIDVCYFTFSALRIHAINNHNWFWTMLIVLLGCVSIPPNIISIFETRYEAVPPPLSGCAETTSSLARLDLPIWNRVAVASTVSAILMDALVLGITWYRTAGIFISARKVHLDTSLVYLMLRDGTTFFSLSLGLHIVVIVVDETRQTSLGLVTCIFTSIIMTRFFLNLRTLDNSGMDSKSFSVRLTQTLEFHFSSPTLDNMAAPLDVEGANDDDYDEDEGETDHTHQDLVSGRGSDNLGQYSSVPKADNLDC